MLSLVKTTVVYRSCHLAIRLLASTLDANDPTTQVDRYSIVVVVVLDEEHTRLTRARHDD